jgi:endo-1,4-beta-D-glucanase Y
MPRALAFALTAALGLGMLVSRSPHALDHVEWEQYVARFIVGGRVVDTGNGGVSHSEGQGYGMLLAVAFGDQATFGRLWEWTRRHLQVRDDRLFAWRFDPNADRPVTDQNSAADGDLLIAWALARAATKFDQPAYAAEAEAIAREILATLVWREDGRTILLPAPDGFVHDGVPTVNLSYWIWPAFKELDRLVPSPLWTRLAKTGLELIQAARFGRYRLPPDWLVLDRSPAPSPRFAPVYGYNAIRIPLHLMWGGYDQPWRLAPFLQLRETFHAEPPATVDLVTGALDPMPLSAGARAILDVAGWAVDGRSRPLPRLAEASDYFSASLLLLAKVACSERLEG